jgi:hypothetical protein
MQVYITNELKREFRQPSYMCIQKSTGHHKLGAWETSGGEDSVIAATGWAERLWVAKSNVCAQRVRPMNCVAQLPNDGAAARRLATCWHSELLEPFLYCSAEHSVATSTCHPTDLRRQEEGTACRTITAFRWCFDLAVLVHWTSPQSWSLGSTLHCIHLQWWSCSISAMVGFEQSLMALASVQEQSQSKKLFYCICEIMHCKLVHVQEQC